MNIVYIFNSSVPSYNANSLQVVNMCHNIAKYVGKITLITPNTGLSKTIFDHYGLEKISNYLRLNILTLFQEGLNFIFIRLFL